MAKKDKKAKTADKKLRTEQKREKQEKKKDKKSSKKNEDDSDAEDFDIDAVLKQYVEQQEQFLKVTETVCDPPTPRSSSTLIASPDNSNELFLFGGEYFNGSLAKFFNELFVYNVKRDEWRCISSSNSPLPRSGHAWCRGGNAGGIYLFGGEFSSPKQGQFYHYNDFWRLDPSTREWSKIETKGKGPPARSGHRMTYYKNFIILFGGFQDTSQQTRYLQELWIYDCQEFSWHSPTLSQKPDARSSFSFLPHDSGAVLYGGYSRVKLATNSKQSKGGPTVNATKTILKPVVHQDTWFLRVEAKPNAAPVVRWERRKKPANAPNPSRAGATMSPHKGRGIQFGGVFDVENSEEGIESEFFNTLFVWNIDRNRFFPLTLRRPRASQKQTGAAERGKRGRARADEEELLNNLAQLEAKDSPADVMQPVEPRWDDYEGKENEKMKQKEVIWEMPHPRFNAQLAVQDDVLYIYGGTFEKGDREFTFDEMYAIDLNKLDGAKEVFIRPLEDWLASDVEESDEDDEDAREDDDFSDEETDDRAENEGSSIAASEAHSTPLTAPTETSNEPEEETMVLPDIVKDDNLPQPRPFESLRDFFNRTSNIWQEMLHEELKRDGELGGGKTVKGLRKEAFERADVQYWDMREEIRMLEDEQEQAGIGEVVNLADKQAQGSSGGKRR